MPTETQTVRGTSTHASQSVLLSQFSFEPQTQKHTSKHAKGPARCMHTHAGTHDGCVRRHTHALSLSVRKA